LATTCPKCRFENPDDTNFCGKCATPLPGVSGKTPEAATKTIGKIGGELATGALIATKYRVLDKLGAGGMGEVYRAEDLSLNRQVAIKVLPEVFAGDPERLARFQREAKVLASLNHPNIAAIYGVEEADGKRFLVLELVEGETLAERLSKGPLPIEEALNVCRQITEGLEGAHEKSIIHRDLKPSNVKITPEGKVKILDFGLARAYHDQFSEVDLVKSPTITADMTQPGVILGTAAYMSPEQAKGKTVDKRADIWAFGCILYECLAGKRTFRGETVTDTLAAILKSEPDWEALPAAMPYKAKDLLLRCLKKEPRERLHDIADARIELTEVLSQPVVSESVLVSKARSIWKPVAFIIGIVLIGLIAAVIHLLLKAPAAIPVVKTTIDLPAGMQLPRGTNFLIRNEFAFSPNGKTIAFCASTDGSPAKANLFLRAMDSTEAKPIAGTEGARMPFFSPDGQWIGFWAKGKMQKISLAGGIPISLFDSAGIPMGATWGSNGKVIFGTFNSGLLSVDTAGGKPEELTVLDPTKETRHCLPHFLPGAKEVIFTVMPDILGTRSHIEVLSIESGKRKLLINEGADARYLPTGHLVYMREGTLVAVPFDRERLEVSGAAVPVVDGVMQAINALNTANNCGSGQFGFSESGSLVYVSGNILPDPIRKLFWIDRQGKSEPITFFSDKPILCFRLSPNGQIIAYSTQGRKADVWLYNLTSGTSTILTTEGRASFLSWAPDGNRLVITFSKVGNSNLYWLPWDGSGPIERLTNSQFSQHAGSWTPDGRFLAFVEQNLVNRDICIFQMDTKQIKPFINTPLDDEYPEFSPDGRWLAYSSEQSSPGRYEVFVTAFPGPGKKLTISDEGGREPLWARNGRELFYWNLDHTKLMATEITTRPTFQAGKPHVLFEHKCLGSIPIRNYDITPDGQRFLIAEQGEIKPVEVTRLNIIQNWFEELKRLVPTGKK